MDPTDWIYVSHFLFNCKTCLKWHLYRHFFTKLTFLQFVKDRFMGLWRNSKHSLLVDGQNKKQVNHLTSLSWGLSTQASTVWHTAAVLWGQNHTKSLNVWITAKHTHTHIRISWFSELIMSVGKQSYYSGWRKCLLKRFVKSKHYLFQKKATKPLLSFTH